MKQKLTTLKHAVAPLLENVGKLFGGRVPQVCAGLGEYFRDVYDHLVRINQSIDAARETVKSPEGPTMRASPGRRLFSRDDAFDATASITVCPFTPAMFRPVGR